MSVEIGSKMKSENSYGQNGFDKPSSETTIGSINAPFTAVKADAVLDQVKAAGTGRSTTSSVGNQVRKVDGTMLPLSSGMHSPNKLGEKVPSTCGFNEAQPARSPTKK